MQTALRISTALSAVVGIPVTITLFPPLAIPIAATLAIATATAIVVWHLHHGGRALIRRTPKGTLTFVLDSKRRDASPRGRK